MNADFDDPHLLAAYRAGEAKAFEVLYETGAREAAFEFALRAKSRALVDLLVAGREGRAGGESYSARKLQHLRERLNAVYQKRVRGEASDSAHREARELEEEIGRLLRERGIHSGGAEGGTASDAPDLEAIRANLEPGVVLVEYLQTPKSLFAFA